MISTSLNASPPHEIGNRAVLLPSRAGAGIIAAVLIVVAGWTAPLLGVAPVLSNVVLTLCFALLVGLAIREFDKLKLECASTRDRLEALRDSERRLRLLADHSADMIVEADGRMVSRSVSSGSRTLLGYVPDDLIGLAGMDIVHPEDVRAFRSALENLLDGPDERLVTTQRYRRKDGSYVWTEADVRVIRDPLSGRATGYLSSLRDITARRAAETAARAGEIFLRGVIDASPDCIKVLDLDGQVNFISRNGVYLLGFDSPDQPIGRDFASFWPAADQASVRSSLAAAAAGASSRFTTHCFSAKGRPLHLDVSVSPILGVDGSPERLLVLSRDVTVGTEAEAALRRIQDQYRLLAENSSDVVMLCEPGPQGPALYVSPSSKRVLGYAPETVVASSPSALIHPDDRAAVAALLRTLGPNDGIVLHTHRMRRADGGFVWMEGAYLMAERSGEPTVVVELRDVTERQNRTRDLALAKEAAEEARHSAEQASEAKSQFLAAMSHEIRTPLNGILGFTDLMIAAGDLPEEAQRQAELIRASGDALLTVLNDVLDFSKIEAGAVELEVIPFSPAALARHCADILRGYAGAQALEIGVEIGEHLPPRLLGDEARLRQVLLNLLNNAVKFTPRGGITLRLSHLDSSESGETIRFEVADSGIGIPMAKQHRLFDRFTQVDSSVARRFGGSGLGLAICKKLVDLMGGSIGVSSREGEGSTFWFTVVLPRGEERAAAVVLPPAQWPSRPARILLVEDIDINQRLAVAFLQGFGHQIDVVGDGALAVRAVAETAYDLVLMDVQMPGVDGVTATRLIRASGGPFSAVPIIAMTANVYPDQIRAFRDDGMNAHIGKPLNRLQLQSLVAQWTGGNRGAATGTGAGSVTTGTKPFDEPVYRAFAAHLGSHQLDEVLERLAASLPARFAGDEAEPDNLRRWHADAHVVVAAAGMVGFLALAECCRNLEASLGDADARSLAIAEARRARDDALERIVLLRAAIPASGAPGESRRAKEGASVSDAGGQIPIAG